MVMQLQGMRNTCGRVRLYVLRADNPSEELCTASGLAFCHLHALHLHTAKQLLLKIGSKVEIDFREKHCSPCVKITHISTMESCQDLVPK